MFKIAEAQLLDHFLQFVRETCGSDAEDDIEEKNENVKQEWS